jgi:hypothetical protein
MRKNIFVTYLFLAIGIISFTASAQHLTISASGETGTSGTNWGISANVLYVGSSGSASINTSVITNHLQNTGDLTINLPGQLNVARNTYINNTIAYLGSSARTLTFQSGNDIVFANAVGITSATASLNIVLRSATTTGTPDNGSVKMDGINIDTKGGHLWVGGGASTATWNGLNVGNSSARTYLDDVAGISVVGSTIASGGGNIYMNALSWNSSDDDGVNYGINVQNSNISSGAGAIYFNADLYGRYTNGIAMYVAGTTAITSTTGAIYIRGYGIDQTTNGNSWRVATQIQGSAQIKSVSGNITVIGDASFTATFNDKEGLNITDGAAICSQTGNITLRGTNTLETSGQYSNSIRFAAANAANSIRIGYDGTNAYSGNITIEGNSIYQRSTQAGAGSIAVQTTGTLTIQPTGTAFTYMRASDASTLTFDNDWNFGTTLGGFVFGKTTNTTALTYSNALTTNGPITMYAGALDQSGAISSSGAITFNCASFSLGDGKNLSTSTASDITINANDHFGTAGSTRRTISSANGSIIINADKDANGSGTLDLDYLTFNPGTSATIIRGETVGFAPGSVSGPYINGTGSFTIQSSDATFGPGIYTSWFEIDQDNNGIGGLTLGKIGNTTDIQQNTSLTVAGPVNMYGGNIVSTASLTATNSDLSLYASTAVTQTSPIIAAGLSLNGTGTFTLNNASNNFTTLAGGAVGSLLGTTQIVDVSGGLTIGTLGSNIGLKGSSTIRIETLAGDLTLAGSISTTSTSTDAVILTAAKSTAIGVPAGGDILVSGSPTITMGTGGIAKLFSGYDVTSTGLTALAGGASNVRINYDETTTTFNPTLSANNKYAIYRTAEGYGDLTIVSSGGDAEGTTWNHVNGVIKTLSGSANVLNTVVQTKLNAANLSIEANKIIFSANVAGSTSNTLSILAKTHIVNTNATTITTQGGNVLFASNVDNAADGESTTNGYIQLRQGITINSNGGNITFGGGNTSGSDYALGSSDIAYTEGIRFDAVIALNSGGGNITLRGKSYDMGVFTGYGASGVGFYHFSAATGTINSGTGTITIDGFSQTNTSSYASGIYSMHNITITSANTTADAIRLIGKATGTSGEAWGIETESIFSVLATGTGGGITVSSSQQNSGNNYDIVFRGETNILAKSGPINLLGGQSGGIANGTMFFGSNAYLGSKTSSAVLTSSSNVTIQYDMYNFSNLPPKLATSGTLNWKPVSASFGQNVGTDYFAWSQNSQTVSGLTIGKSGNAVIVYLNSAFTVAGPISVYGGYVEVSSAITSSATGDILLKGIANIATCVNISSGGITKTSSTGTLTMQGHGRVNNSGTISASGTGVLNVVMWSDYDGDNVGGGSTLGGGSISTNGGHIWMGGSNSNGGSYSWNGLTVGDGPSTGASGSNCHAIDIFGAITTGGGDVLLWASNNGGCGLSGIQSDVTRHINAGSGDITLIAYQTGGAIELTSTGVISLVPHAGSYAGALTLGGTLTSGNFTFNTSYYNGLKINSIANSGLVIGNYSDHLSGGTAVTQGNTSTVTASSALSTKSLEIYGGAVVASATLTAAGNIILDGDNGNFLSQNTKGVEINAAVSTTNNGNITINGRGGNATAINTHGINVTNLVEAGGTGNIQLIGYGGLSANGTGSSCHGVNIEGANAWVKSNGGNVAITGYGGGAGAGTYSQGVPMLTSAKVSAGGSGTVTITGNGGVNAAAGLRGVVINSGSSIYSAGGAISINGTNGTNGSDNSDGVTIDASTVGSNSSGAITISGQAGGGIGSDAISLSNTNTLGAASHSNNIVLRGNNFSVSGTTSVLTNGKVTIEPKSNSFTSALTFPIPNMSIANTITGLTIGKPTNSANITFANTTTINGPITVYGGTLAVNQNVASSAGSTISLFGNALNFANGKTVTTSGLLIVAPQDSSNSIGLAGAIGTLQLPTSYFTTNFTDGFSTIQIGTSNHTSAISSKGFSLRDNMSLYTSGPLSLGGKPVLGSNNLTLGPDISLITSGDTTYFQTNGTGKVFRNIPNGSNLIFPIGRAIYNPVTIKNNSGAADDFSALVLDSVFLNGTTGPLITTPHVKTTWDISKTNPNGGSGIDFEFGWKLSQEVGTFTSYKLNHFASTWAFAEGTSQTPSGSTIKGMSHSGYTGTFSPFAISEGTSALPVELISFNANCISNETKIEWQTASEHNTNHFAVERSFEGTKWEKLGEVTAAVNSTSIRNYSLIDTSLVARALTYYRLIQVDIDGKSETFGPVSSDCATNNAFEVVIAPNPNDGVFTLKIEAEYSQEIDIRIYQMDGQEVARNTISVPEGTSLHYIDLEGFASGIYTLHIHHRKGVLIKKTVIK